MVSENQVGTSTEYESEYVRHLELWPEEWLLILEPSTKDCAINYWNACNKVKTSEKVREHFLACMQQFR